MKNFLFLAVGMLLFVQVNAQSDPESENPIDVRYSNCIDADPSTVGMCECAATAQREWDAELNKYYQLLKADLNETEKLALRDAQRKWLEYRDLEFELANNYLGNMDGTMYRVILADRKCSIIRARALELISYYELSHM